MLLQLVYGLCLVLSHVHASPVPSPWDSDDINTLVGLSQGIPSYGSHGSADDLDLDSQFQEDVMNNNPTAEEVLEDKLNRLQAALESYANRQEENDANRLSDVFVQSKRVLRKKSRSDRIMHPRVMRNVLDAMPPELISHILQGNREPPTPESLIETFTPPESNLRGGGLSVGLDLDALSGMMAAMRRQNYGQRLKQSHKKLLNIGRK